MRTRAVTSKLAVACRAIAGEKGNRGVHGGIGDRRIEDYEAARNGL